MNALVSTHSFPSIATRKSALVQSREAWEENPYLRLWNGLTPIIEEARGLRLTFEHATTMVKSADRAPRHDTYLTGDQWCGFAMGAVWSDDWSLDVVQRELRQSIKAIETARSAINRRFRGDTKVKTEDALTRHLAEAQRLLGTFQELESAQTPCQPYLVRQKCLSIMLRDIGTLLDLITPLRRELRVEEFPDGLYTQLVEQEAVLFRLRANGAKWRDNPSQRLGAKLELCLEQAQALLDTMSRLRNAAEAECKRQGM
jgi:hypothetical protein